MDGSIVSISSVASQGWIDSAHYCASKGRIVQLTRTMAMELRPLGIRANAVSPDVIETAHPRGGYLQDALVEMVSTTLAKRMGSAGEVADAVVYLPSFQSSFVTGQTLHVNGGAFTGG